LSRDLNSPNNLQNLGGSNFRVRNNPTLKVSD
jgi:hypothetical protein